MKKIAKIVLFFFVFSLVPAYGWAGDYKTGFMIRIPLEKKQQPVLLALAQDERTYIKVGADPVSSRPELKEGEKLFRLPVDTFMKVLTGSGKEISGWIKAGEVVVIKQRIDGIWAAIRIYECGNPIISEITVEYKEGVTATHFVHEETKVSDVQTKKEKKESQQIISAYSSSSSVQPEVKKASSPWPWIIGAMVLIGLGAIAFAASGGGDEGDSGDGGHPEPPPIPGPGEQQPPGI